MIQKLKSSYEKLFMLQGHDALKEAVKFIIDNKKAKTVSEIAKVTHVSSSTMSAYMCGDKSISKTFTSRLNEFYNIDLVNPLTYRIDSVKFHEEMIENFPMISTAIFFKMYQNFSKLVHGQQAMIEKLRNSNDELRKMNIQLYDFIIKNEEELVETLISLKKKEYNN